MCEDTRRATAVGYQHHNARVAVVGAALQYCGAGDRKLECAGATRQRRYVDTCLHAHMSEVLLKVKIDSVFLVM